jgi:hypothetical protein
MIGKHYNIQVDELMEDDLKEISSMTNLSHEEVVFEILDYVLDSSHLIREIFAGFIPPMALKGETGDKCSGECRGKGRAKKWVDGKCPDPCDKDILDSLEQQAKNKARLDAIWVCLQRGGDDCLCTGGTQRRKSRRCKTYVSEEDGSKRTDCKYIVSYRYEGGSCKTT